MKKTIAQLCIIGLVCGLAAATSQAQSQQKIGIINLKKAFDNYWKTKQADIQLKDRAGEFEKQHKEIVDNYQKANEEYKKLLDSANDQAVSSEERDKRKRTAEGKLRDIQGVEQQLRQFDTTARSTLGEQQRRMRDSILAEIQDEVKKKAKAAGYTLILDSAAESVNAAPVLVFTSGDNDITDEVVNALNATAPPSVQKDAPAATPGNIAIPESPDKAKKDKK
jgi:outer membrane protein